MPETTQRVSIQNTTGRTISFVLEPWGEEHWLPVGECYTVVAEGPEPGTLEVDVRPDQIVVFAWVGSVAYVFRGEEELNPGLGPRPRVPGVPEGSSVAGFLRGILGR